jgi:hypothetical protein
MTESVKVRCPACQTKLRMKGESVYGRKILCPQCGQKIRVNAPTIPEAEVLSEPTQPNKRPAPKTKAADDEFFELPSERRKSSPTRAAKKSTDDESFDLPPSRTKKRSAAAAGSNDDDFLDSLTSGSARGGSAASDDADLPLSGYQRNQIKKKKKAEDKTAGKHKKKRRASAGESATLNFVTWTAAAGVGGLIGAMLWAGLAYATGFQIGIMAWVVGGLVGVSVCIVKNDEGTGPGLVAGAVAVFAILGGKFAAAMLIANAFTDELIHRDVSDNQVMIAYVADQVVEEWENEGRELKWPGLQIEVDVDAGEAQADLLADGEEDEDWDAEDFRMGKDDYPIGVWDEAETRWKGKKPEEQQALRDAVTAEDNAADEEAGAAKGFFIAIVFLSCFSWRDFIWIPMAVGTAYRVALGISNE